MCSDVPTREGALAQSHLTQRKPRTAPPVESFSRRIAARGHPPSRPATLARYQQALSISTVTGQRETLPTQPPIHCLWLPKPMKPTSSDSLQLAI
jgi:hypothetical protein